MSVPRIRAKDFDMLSSYANNAVSYEIIKPSSNVETARSTLTPSLLTTEGYPASAIKPLHCLAVNAFQTGRRQMFQWVHPITL